MTTVRKYVQTLSEAELLEIISDYEKFETEGAIGDSLLRKTAEIFAVEGSITRWMELVAFEAYRVFAELHIRGLSKTTQVTAND